MKPLRAFIAFAFFFLCGSYALALQASTPEGALEEMVTTDKLEVFTRHVPIELQEEIERLDAKDKMTLSNRFLIRNLMQSEGLTLARLEDGITWEVRKGEHREGSIRLKNSFLSGSEAFLMFQLEEEKELPKDGPASTEPAATREKHTLVILVSMQVQNGDWRVIGFGPWQEQNLDSRDILKKLMGGGGGHGEFSAAASTMRTLITALHMYQDTYPEVGLPATLQALSGAPGTEASAEHAMLLDPTFAQPAVVKDGYGFGYTLIDPGIQKGSEARYRITATPLDFSQSGQHSLFVDQSGVIRFTTAHREANENDPPLEPSPDY